ncbi:MAG: superoxide dismutase, partial [Candidatus Diapherotrites archaeon]|nr:superoxide dismutase [Candidatus Diapherotrites archaeon]
MDYEVKNFSNLLGTEGFSNTLLENHFKLYSGYVAATNKAAKLMQETEPGYEWGEVRRRFGWEFNGMRLHELYFGNMTNGGASLDESADLNKLINEQFGSVEKW